MGGRLFGSCDFFLILLCRYRMWKLYSQVIWNILKAKTWIAKQTPAICIYSYIKTQKVSKSNFLISISLNPNGVNLWFFKFTLFDLAEYHLTAFTNLYNFTFKLFLKNIILLKIGFLESGAYSGICLEGELKFFPLSRGGGLRTRWGLKTP